MVEVPISSGARTDGRTGKRGDDSEIDAVVLQDVDLVLGVRLHQRRHVGLLKVVDDAVAPCDSLRHPKIRNGTQYTFTRVLFLLP